MKSKTAEELGRVFNAVTATMNAQESIGRPINAHGMDLFNHLVVELFDPRTRLEWESSICESSDPPSHEVLIDFIWKRMLALSAAKPKNIAKSSGEAPRPAKAHHARPGSDPARCALCKGKHPLMQCSDFKAKSADERKSLVESHRLCFNCLGNHFIAKCQSTKTCLMCRARHHTMLHNAYTALSNNEVNALSAVHESKDCKAILLATARVLVADRHGHSHAARALIDQGSEIFIVSEALV
ncbi:uncharacterized protein [Anoplolepis gracilipes]|uniref:uncharacterized protein n=1 Tax=Anoplolepis gracilipes TaxID=354296 RepID=UPI003BA2A559